MLAAVFHNTASVDQCCNLAPVTSVTTFKNWWQLGFHPKFAIDTLSFYSVPTKGVHEDTAEARLKNEYLIFKTEVTTECAVKLIIDRGTDLNNFEMTVFGRFV